MRYRVLETPDPSLAEIGDVLTVDAVAQLVEVNAAEMVSRSQGASKFWHCGFAFEVIGDSDSEAQDSPNMRTQPRGSEPGNTPTK